MQRRAFKVASGQDCQEQKQLLCRGGPADQDEHVKVETRVQQNPRGDSQGYIGQELQQLKQGLVAVGQHDSYSIGHCL